MRVYIYHFLNFIYILYYIFNKKSKKENEINHSPFKIKLIDRN